MKQDLTPWPDMFRSPGFTVCFRLQVSHTFTYLWRTDLLKFKPSIRMGKKGVLSDFERGMVVGKSSPCEDLQKTFDLCHCQHRVYNKVLRWNFVIDQVLIFHHNLQINSLKILQCDFLDFLLLILSLIVEVYLWWKLQASLIFLSGRTCTVGGWLNTFFAPLYIYIYTGL